MTERRYPLYRKVYQALRGRILSAEYEPGSQIETEPRLAEIHGASLITIRQAEQMLVDDGLLVKQQGRGTFVAAAVARRLKVLGVCGLMFTDGHRNLLGAYFSDLLVFSQEEAALRGLEFETVWLPTFVPERSKTYLGEQDLREFLGFVFVGCGEQHPVLQRVRTLNLRHVVISPNRGARNTVWLDYDQAIRLAAGVFPKDSSKPVLIMGQDHMRAACEAAVRECGRECSYIGFPSQGSGLDFETLGYEKMRELMVEGRDVSRLLLLDGIIARGATRALLKNGAGSQKPEIVLICGKQEIIPLGLPVTYVAFDTREEVRHAFALLDRQRSDKTGTTESFRVESFLLLNPFE